MKDFILKITDRGKGVFANRDFNKDENIIDFKGRIFTSEELPAPYDKAEDHYVQIDKNKYLGPSGGLDDFINHSCNPNSGLIIKNSEIILIAIEGIKKGEEINWDYSTTIYEDDWEMNCKCGSENCRKNIREFKYLPKSIQERYMKLGIVPDYVLK